MQPLPRSVLPISSNPNDAYNALKIVEVFKINPPQKIDLTWLKINHVTRLILSILIFLFGNEK